MSTYREIHGKAIKSLSTDPSDAAVGGQIWYNTSSDTFKTVVTVSGFSSGAAINQARGYMGGITGTAAQSAGLIFGGNTSGPTSPGNDSTEEYNGSGWATSGNLGTGRLSISGFGIQTAAVGMGGRTPGSAEVNTTEEYDGSAWTAGGALTTARRYLSGAGTLTSGLAFAGTTGGAPGAGTPQTVTEEYNGTAWTGGGALGTARQRGCGTGASQTAAICFGGSVAPVTGNTEVYDGSSWSEQSNMNTGKASGMGFGLSTLAVATGGESTTASYTTTTEDWNGTSWSTNPATLPTGNQAMGGQGAATAGLLAGGWKPAPVGNTSLEYSSSINVITAAAWASGGALTTARLGSSSFGTQTAGVVAGGRVGSPGGTTATEEYNGTSWGPGGALNTSRQYSGGAGILTAGLAFGGNVPPAVIVKTEEYNGTAWTENPSPSGDMNTGRRALAGFGTQTSAVAAGGEPNSNLTEDYNGTAWTAGNTLTTGRQYLAGAGASNTSGVVFGGNTPTETAATEELTGEAWTAGGPLITARGQVAGDGTQTAALAFGGYTTTAVGTTEGYDGTAWSTRPSLATARYDANGLGTQELAIAAGGDPGPITTTEEFTEQTSTVNVKTLTQS